MKGQFPWIGRSRGSAGGMTTAKINDKNVMRAKAFEVTNPKTAAQVMQRDFFKEVQEVCASVSEDQLRSLFGIKPKTMSRRNALSKQIAAAYTIEDGVKSIDFSKLLAIGNGEKVKTEISHKPADENDWTVTVTPQELGNGATMGTIIVGVIFDATLNKIYVRNNGESVEDGFTINETMNTDIIDNDLYIYLTCATDYSNVFGKSFGSFTIKTRATD